MAVFKNLLPVLKIYNLRNVHYIFLVLAVNFETQLISAALSVIIFCFKAEGWRLYNYTVEKEFKFEYTVID